MTEWKVYRLTQNTLSISTEHSLGKMVECRTRETTGCLKDDSGADVTKDDQPDGYNKAALALEYLMGNIRNILS